MSVSYYKPFTDSHNFTHSIDMIYCEYYSYIPIPKILDILREVHELFPDIRYQEYLDRKPCSKFDFYLNNVVFGGAHFDIGKYRMYDKTKKDYKIINMFQLRVNPNKYMCEEWFTTLLKKLLPNVSSGYIRKYDYAVDIPCNPKYVDIVNTRKERGLYKGTRYFGQAGRHGYVKIYDKKKDLEKIGVEVDTELTRVEHTLFNSQKVSLEKAVVYDSNSMKKDYSSLKDTDIAIIEMYLMLKKNDIPYDLKLGRVKMDKLREYLEGDFLEIDFSPLGKLLEQIAVDFKCSDKSDDPEEFMDIPDEELEHIEEMFGL